MALGDDFITSAELKAYLNISDSDDNTEIALAVSVASRWVRHWCGRDFNQAGTGNETARKFRPDNAWVLHVDDFAETDNLAIKTDEDDDGTFEVTWTSTDYELHPLNQVMEGITGWPYTAVRAVESFLFPLGGDRASVEITANWGWPAIPDEVKQATLIQAAAYFKRRDSPEGVLGGFGDFGAVRVGTRLDPTTEQLLMPYRKAPVGVG